MLDNFDDIAEAGRERHEERCPTCGKFVPGPENYEATPWLDLPPGGFQSHDLLVAYCNQACGDAKSPKAHYEDDEDFDEAYFARFKRH